MKNIVLFLLKLTAFWFSLFVIQHTVFLLFNYNHIKEIGLAQIFLSYRYAFSMDLSATAYLLSLPTLLLIISLFLKNNKPLINAVHIINIILIVFCLIIGIADASLYYVWGTKINAKAISYLAYPKEALISFTSVPYALFFILLIEGYFAIYFYKKFLKINVVETVPWFQKIVFPIVIIPLLVIAIRGGIQSWPISKNWVYYSKYTVLNNSAVNGFWNFVSICITPTVKSNPYEYFTKNKADQIVCEMHKCETDSTQIVINTERPNIVFILLESVSGECMQKLGGEECIMPGLDSIAADGLLFTNFYANGFRTEQGQISVFTGFPAQPQTTIMREFGKFDKLPNLPKLLGEQGYSENYYYSGSTEFANTEAFFKSSGFEKILNESNYTWKHKTHWGAYDEEVFDCHLREADKDPQPFFSVIMTSTSHEPFDADVEKIFKGNTDADNYKNTVHYTDKCLSDYLRMAKTKSWYANTLFVIMADHAHSYPKGRNANEAERHLIPFLFYGNVLNEKYRGKTIETVGSQIDFPAILLAQLKLDHSQFVRSKNLLCKKTPEFAFYTFDNGFGIITTEQTLVYDHDLGQVVYRKCVLPNSIDSAIVDKGKAYLQTTFHDYIMFNN